MPLPKIHMIRQPDGARYLSLATDVGVAELMKLEGAYTPEHVGIATKILEESGGDGLLLDIGANIGAFSIPVARATGCRVHAFEAQRIISQILCANYILSGIGNAIVENVVLGPPGIGSSVSIAAIDYTLPGNFGAFTTSEEIFDRHSGRKMFPTSQRENIRAAILDSFQLEGVLFIKIDVEGSELDVLRGGQETIVRNGYPPILFEAWRKTWFADKKRELLGFIEGLGYAVTAMDEEFLAQHPAHLGRVSAVSPTIP